MQSAVELQQLLETQFGPFIRDNRYKHAFDRAMQSLQQVPPTAARIDIFYLFLHQLVLELFEEIERLDALLQRG